MGIPTMMDFMAFREVNPMEVNQPTFFLLLKRGLFDGTFPSKKTRGFCYLFCFFDTCAGRCACFFCQAFFFFKYHAVLQAFLGTAGVIQNVGMNVLF